MCWFTTSATVWLHLVLESSLLTVIYQLVEAGNGLFDWLPILLALGVESGSFKNDVLANFEKCVELDNDGVVCLLLLGRNIGGWMNILGCLSHTIEEHGNFLTVLFASKSGGLMELMLKSPLPSRPLIWRLEIEGGAGCNFTLAMMLKHFWSICVRSESLGVRQHVAILINQYSRICKQNKAYCYTRHLNSTTKPSHNYWW